MRRPWPQTMDHSYRRFSFKIFLLEGELRILKTFVQICDHLSFFVHQPFTVLLFLQFSKMKHIRNIKFKIAAILMIK